MIVGVTDQCNYPPAAAQIERVSGFGTPNVEKLLALGPDLVIACGLEKPELTEVLRQAGIQVVDVQKTGFIASFPDLFDAIRQIGEATGRSAEGKRTRRRHAGRIGRRRRPGRPDRRCPPRAGFRRDRGKPADDGRGRLVHRRSHPQGRRPECRPRNLHGLSADRSRESDRLESGSDPRGPQRPSRGSGRAAGAAHRLVGGSGRAGTAGHRRHRCRLVVSSRPAAGRRRQGPGRETQD